MAIEYTPIGHFMTPHKDVRDMPIQPRGALGVRGGILVLPEYRDGLADLDGFSHVIVLYHLHRVRGRSLRVTPFLDTREHGIFATRSPARPNPVGLSVLRLVAVTELVVYLENVDVLDGTPVIDIKPYVPDFDAWPAERVGWFEGRACRASAERCGERFACPKAELVED